MCTPANCCCLDRRVMRLKAASAVEAHRRQPHFVQVRVVAIGKRLHFEGLTSSSSRRMLMAACILVLWAQKNGEFGLLPQHAPSSAWRTGLPRAGVSSVTVCRRRPCRKTGPPPSFADGKGPRHQLLPAASVSSCSPPWTHPARPCSGRSRAPSPAAF